MEEIIVKLANVLIGGVKAAAGFIVTRAMSALGISWASFEYALPQVKAYLEGFATGLPSQAVQLFSAAGVDVFMTLIISAYVARYGLELMLVGATRLQSMIQQAGG